MFLGTAHLNRKAHIRRIEISSLNYLIQRYTVHRYIRSDRHRHHPIKNRRSSSIATVSSATINITLLFVGYYCRSLFTHLKHCSRSNCGNVEIRIVTGQLNQNHGPTQDKPPQTAAPRTHVVRVGWMTPRRPPHPQFHTHPETNQPNGNEIRPKSYRRSYP